MAWTLHTFCVSRHLCVSVILYLKMHNVLKCCTEHKMDAAELNPQMLIIKALWDKRLISTQTSDVHPVKFVSSRGQQIRDGSAHTGIIKAYNAQTCLKRTKLYKNTHNKTTLKIKEGNHPWSYISRFSEVKCRKSRYLHWRVTILKIITICNPS